MTGGASPRLALQHAKVSCHEDHLKEEASSGTRYRHRNRSGEAQF